MRGYSYINVFGIGFLVCQGLQQYEFFARIPIYILFPICVMGVWMIGYLDTRFKMLNAERQFEFLNIPQIEEIKQKLEEIEEKIK